MAAKSSSPEPAIAAVSLRCPRCASPIDAHDVDVDRLLAECRRCGAVFSFRDRLPSLPGEEGPVHAPGKVELPRPAEITVQKGSLGTQVFCLRWFSRGRLPTLLTIATLAFFTSGTIVEFLLKSRLSPMDFGLAVLFLGWNDALVAYVLVAHFLNRTEVSVSGGYVHIRHRPLPWWGGTSVSVVSLQQLFCKAEHYLGIGKHRYSSFQTFGLYALLNNGFRRKLVSGLHDPDLAWYLEQEIEKRLGIEDRHVQGEFQ